MLYDVIIYSKGGDGHLLECDAMVIDDCVQHLKKYSLRAKVIARYEGYDVIHVGERV